MWTIIWDNSDKSSDQSGLGLRRWSSGQGGGIVRGLGPLPSLRANPATPRMTLGSVWGQLTSSSSISTPKKKKKNHYNVSQSVLRIKYSWTLLATINIYQTYSDLRNPPFITDALDLTKDEQKLSKEVKRASTNRKKIILTPLDVIILSTYGQETSCTRQPWCELTAVMDFIPGREQFSTECWESRSCQGRDQKVTTFEPNHLPHLHPSHWNSTSPSLPGSMFFSRDTLQVWLNSCHFVSTD